MDLESFCRFVDGVSEMKAKENLDLLSRGDDQATLAIKTNLTLPSFMLQYAP